MVGIVAVAHTVGTATLVEWAKLQLDACPPEVVRVSRVRNDANGHPLVYEQAVLPLARFPGWNGDQITDIKELADQYGLSLARATERISVVPAVEDVAAQLRVAVGADVVKLDRVTETTSGEPIEWRLAFVSKERL